MVKLFVDGGWAMCPLLVLLVLGVAVAIERLITLSRAGIDAESFFNNFEEIFKSTRGRPGLAWCWCSMASEVSKRARPKSCADALPPPSRAQVVRGPALVPPSVVETWDPMLLGSTELFVQAHEMFNGENDATVTALSGVLTDDECRAWIGI